MTKRTATALLGILLVTGCTTHDDLRTRYRLERMLWHAQFFERRIRTAFFAAGESAVHQAIAAYQSMVAADPLRDGAPSGWDPDIINDIARLEVQARIALAQLYVTNQRYADAGSIYDETVRLGSTNFKDLLDTRVGAARRSPVMVDPRDAMEQCAPLFRDVDRSDVFWAGDGAIRESFLNIPLARARLETEERAADAAESVDAAIDFYTRVQRTWPGLSVDWQARLANVQLLMLRDEWAGAARELEVILSAPGLRTLTLSNLEFVLGEIYGFRLNDPAAARRHFESVRARDARSAAAYAAEYDTAVLDLAGGDEAAAMTSLRKLETTAGVPAAVASRAMFTRGHILDGRGQWDDAYAMYRRLGQLYPFTNAALEAPLVVTRHYATTRNREMLDLVVKRARDYYASLLGRNSNYAGNRAAVQTALVENFVAAGEAAAGAKFLAAGDQPWDDASIAGGMLKAADLYHHTLNDDIAARTTLERVIARFPGSREERAARQQLAALATSR
ncbi:MAG TPA: tetratricopeptide repeat protein [Candidatus Krumholzibacteria bacterium]|nr:tetratricopeptide repeat protein [Candidatus Krumholzibacteria bacterium]